MKYTMTYHLVKPVTVYLENKVPYVGTFSLLINRTVL